MVLNPKPAKMELPALGLKSSYQPNKIRSVRLVGRKGKIDFEQDDEKLTLVVPENRPNEYT